MEGAQSVDTSQKPKTNKVHPVNNIDKNKKKADIIHRAKDKLRIWRHKSRESSFGKNNLSNQVSGLMRDYSGTSQMAEMDTQESITGVQSRLICHVPDFVWQAEDQVIDTPKAIMTNGVLLFADVSGFTALTERYSNHREGVSGLTHALNGYISAICQKILENGGDILKFAGDAILALWKCERKMLPDCIALATHCSLEIQQNHDWQMTSVGVELRVKIAIAAGKIYCTHVGLPGQVRHIAMSGNPVGEVNAAEKHCESGDVVLSSNAWDLCNRATFKGFEVGDGRHKFFKVKFMTRKNFSPDEFESWKAPNPYPMISEIYNNKKQDERPAREACLLYNNKNLETYIRQYISKTVQEKLDDGQPRDYLSEIRQCTILFINLVFDLKEQRRDYTIKLGTTLQDSFEIVDDELRKKGGQLNKLFMFDKGCTFLAAFGLPGTKNEREAALALECAFKISKRMTNEIIELNRCSIGVTTGSVYVGVIGHEERHEYSFLGPKVNMAARIMMAGYPGMVNCDALTMKCSDLSPDYFIAQAYKPLKGIKDPGVIYQYTETMPPLTSYIRRNVRPEYPILGRIDEIDRIMAETCSGEDRCFVVIEGDKGIGKTRLLEEIVIISQNIDANLHVVNISTSFDIMKDDFKIVRIIIEDLLGIIDQIDRSPNSFAEKAILETLQGSKYSKDNYDLINPIFGTYINGKAMYQSQIKLTKDIDLQSEMIQYIMNKCLDNFERSLILIDCAQFIDSMSWKVLNHFANDSRASIVVSYRPQVSADVVHDQHRLTAFNHPDNLHLRLSSLPNEYFPALACQMLRVTQISETLTAGIIYKSFGNPGWTLLILKSLLDQALIKINVKGEVEHGQICHEPPKELITSRNHQYAEAAKKAAEGAGHMIGGRHSSTVTQNQNRQSSRLTKQLSKSILNRSMKSTTDRGTVYKHPAIKTVLEDDDEDDDDIQRDRSQESTMMNKKAHHQGKQYMDILKKIGGYYEDILTQGDADPDTERECILTTAYPIKLPTLLQSIVAPQVIKSFILQQLDRLPPTTQQVAKECALVGEYFSRHIIYHLNSGKGSENSSTDKIDRAFQHLIDAKIIEPIKTQINMSRHAKPVQNVPNARKSSLLKQIHVKTDTQCEHLRFINSFYHEVIDNLWLDEQRAYLHKQCATYFQSCLDELTLNQNVTHKTIIEFAVHRECKRDVSRRQKSVCNILNINIQEFDDRRVAFDASRLKHPLLFDNFGVITKTAMTDDWPETSHTGYKEIRGLYKKRPKPDKEQCSSGKFSISGNLKNALDQCGSGLSDNFVEELQTVLDAQTIGVLPSESDLFIAVLSPVLMRHYENARDTEATLRFTLESADALLRTGNLKDALSKLDKADEIIMNLRGALGGRKYDMIKDVYEGDTNFHNLDESISVYDVPIHIKAYYEALYGAAHILSGGKDRKHGGKKLKAALKLLEVNPLNCANTGLNDKISNNLKIDLYRRIADYEMTLTTNISDGELNKILKALAHSEYERTAHQIEGYTNCAFLGTLAKKNKDRLSHLERLIAGKILNLNFIQFEEVYTIHKFFLTICQSRISRGDVQGGYEIAQFLLQMSCWAQSQTLYWISQINLCEILFLQDNLPEFFIHVRKLESEIEASTANPEVSCQLNILKLNVILDSGLEIDNFSDIALWSLPHGACSFSNLQIASFSACIALFNIRSNAFDPAYAWRENSWKNLLECPLSFHYVRTFSRLLECDLLVYRSQIFYKNMPHCTLLNKKDISKTVKQNMKIFESYCERFPIFISRLMMFKSFLEQLYDGSKAKGGSKAKEYVKSGIECAIAMNDKPSVERLNSNLEYLEGKRRSDKWVKTILMTVGAKKLSKLKKQKTHFIFTGPYNYPWNSDKQ